ncbi:MAG: nucleotidyltransferase family protein [Dehalococcoidia bacterium]|nr:nucleotidyltransferase family protein [Dehalococcoidia bacterium]
MITKAILLAAGRGTRLGAITATYPKALLEVGDRPIIVRIIEGLAHAGIEEIAIVTGHQAALLEAEVGTGAHAGLGIIYFRQEKLSGTAHALALARDFAGEGQFLFGWGDIVVDPTNYRRVLKAARSADAVIAVNEVDDPSAGAAVYVDSGMRVTRIVEKPPPGTSSTRWNNAGFGVLGPAIWAEIERLAPSPRGEYELPRAIAALVASGANVRAVPVEGPWFDVGTPDDLAAARTAFANNPRGKQ